MGTIPWRVGSTINEKFLLVDSTGAGITGKVQADFTTKISHNTTGAVSTTGLVITEVDAVNNPGAYAVTISGSTGFQASATGEFTVVIYLTTDQTQKFTMTFHVTSDGDFSGSAGAALFSAAASNGRITDGSSPLPDAIVRIRDSGNVLLFQTISDASGLWSVWLSAGTYTIDAQLSGYTTSNSSTITVVGTTATGPLADIALTAASSGSGLTASDLWAYARRMARNRTGNQADTEIKQLVNDALDMVSQECEWPFLLTDRGTFSLDGAYETGTIAIAVGSTTCTLTTGTWPTWAASGKLKVNGKIYFISSRTSGSVIELATAWKDTALTASAFTIFRDEYALASDLQKFGQIQPGQGWGWGADPLGFNAFLALQNEQMFAQRTASYFTIAASKIRMWPYPSQDTLVNYSYYKKPAALTTSSQEADWDPQHVLLLRRAIDYQVALRYEDSVAGDPRHALATYERALAKAKPMDKGPTSLPSLGSHVGRRFDPSSFVPSA